MHLAQGAIGRLAEDYVEGRLEIEGNIRDLMVTAPALFGNDPTLDAGRGKLVASLRAARPTQYLGAHPSQSGEGWRADPAAL